MSPRVRPVSEILRWGIAAAISGAPGFGGEPRASRPAEETPSSRARSARTIRAPAGPAPGSAHCHSIGPPVDPVTPPPSSAVPANPVEVPQARVSAAAPRVSWLQRTLRLTGGKIRRFYLHKFRRSYIEEQSRKREGTCGRCAACCKLLFRCPFLDESSGLPTCSIHDRRPDNCRFFPIDPRDLADRDLIDPTNPCGFSFPSQQRPDPRASAHRADGPHHHHAMGD